MRSNVGPINMSGGEKRLNVAFSRAKHHMAVDSSIHHGEITNDITKGPPAAKIITEMRKQFRRVRRKQSSWYFMGSVDACCAELSAATARSPGCAGNFMTIATGCGRTSASKESNRPTTPASGPYATPTFGARAPSARRAPTAAGSSRPC
jgi:hypothetical protein